MAALALTLCVLYAVALFGVGEVAQRRRTGVAGWARAANATERVANLLVFAAWLLALLGPALVLGDVVEPWFVGGGAQGAGIVVSCASLALAVAAQRTMGAAWRSGIDPEHPAKGLVFDGRVTEDFKLDSGTWVSVGTLRPDIVAACSPFILDAVIVGQDKPFVGVMVWRLLQLWEGVPS